MTDDYNNMDDEIPIFEYLFNKHGKDYVIKMVEDAAPKLEENAGCINSSSFDNVVQDAMKKMGIDVGKISRIEEIENDIENNKRKEIEEMLNFCLERKRSNKFILSLAVFYEKNGYLSRRQRDVLENIYYGY